MGSKIYSNVFIGYLYTDKTVSMIAVTGMDGWKERKKDRKRGKLLFFVFGGAPPFHSTRAFGWEMILLSNDIKTVVSCGSGGRLVIHQTVG